MKALAVLTLFPCLIVACIRVTPENAQWTAIPPSCPNILPSLLRLCITSLPLSLYFPLLLSFALFTRFPTHFSSTLTCIQSLIFPFTFLLLFELSSFLPLFHTYTSCSSPSLISFSSSRLPFFRSPMHTLAVLPLPSSPSLLAVFLSSALPCIH